MSNFRRNLEPVVDEAWCGKNCPHLKGKNEQAYCKLCRKELEWYMGYWIAECDPKLEEKEKEV